MDHHRPSDDPIGPKSPVLINMAKVEVANIEIKNPKDTFTSSMDFKITLKCFQQLEEGQLNRTGVYGHLRWVR